MVEARRIPAGARAQAAGPPAGGGPADNPYLVNVKGADCWSWAVSVPGES